MNPEALEWARRSYEEKPPEPLTDKQQRAVNLFGKIKPDRTDKAT